MTQGTAIHVLVGMLVLAVEVSLPLVGAAFVAGLVVSILQATTQINDPALSFVPKVAAVIAGLVFFGAAMLQVTTTFTQSLWQSIPTLLR